MKQLAHRVRGDEISGGRYGKVTLDNYLGWVLGALYFPEIFLNCVRKMCTLAHFISGNCAYSLLTKRNSFTILDYRHTNYNALLTRNNVGSGQKAPERFITTVADKYYWTRKYLQVKQLEQSIYCGQLLSLIHI